jgi:hypothetical protein
MLMCQTATGMADTRCNQILRSTTQTELLRGPGSYRVNREPEGTIRLLLSQWPVTAVTGIQVAPAVPLPYQFQPVAAGNWAIERPSLGIAGSSVAADSGTGGQAVTLGPCQVSTGGRWAIETTYTAGWPHAGITEAASAGDGFLNVDDVTGWAPDTLGANGAIGVIQDTATGQQEAVTCVAASSNSGTGSGPGVLSLSAGLTYAHDVGILVTCLPNQIQWATALYCAAQALTRGSTATIIQSTRGGSGRTTSSAEPLKMQADQLLAPFRRVV